MVVPARERGSKYFGEFPRGFEDEDFVACERAGYRGDKAADARADDDDGEGGGGRLLVDHGGRRLCLTRKKGRASAGLILIMVL